MELRPRGARLSGDARAGRHPEPLYRRPGGASAAAAHAPPRGDVGSAHGLSPAAHGVFSAENGGKKAPCPRGAGDGSGADGDGTIPITARCCAAHFPAGAFIWRTTACTGSIRCIPSRLRRRASWTFRCPTAKRGRSCRRRRKKDRERRPGPQAASLHRGDE